MNKDEMFALEQEAQVAELRARIAVAKATVAESKLKELKARQETTALVKTKADAA